MTELIFLGTSMAVPNQEHQNSYFVLNADEHVVLVDCGVNPLVRLKQIGLNPLDVTDLFVTHFHPDHVSGLPLFLLDMWLSGREKPLDIFGLEAVIEKVKALLDLYNWESWENFFPVNFYSLPQEEMVPCITSENFNVWASASCHSIPSIGIKMAFPEGSMCYSSDTSPCDAIVRLAKDVDLLIHEATDEDGHGHSTPEQAGQVAMDAGVRSLTLIHYDPKAELEKLKKRAEKTFNGKVVVALDLMTVTFS